MLSSAAVFPAKIPVRVVRRARSLPVAQAATVHGAWRYRAPGLSRPGYAIAIVLSAGLHAAGLLSFVDRPAAVMAAPVEKVKLVQIDLPPLPPEEPEEKMPEDLVDQPVESAALVPQLAEVPTVVPLNAMTQVVDFRPAVEIDATAMKAMTVPLHIGSGRGGNGGPELFNLADLDRVPEPIAQPAPQFPPMLKSEVRQARVTVSFVVDSTGRVLNVQVVDSTHQGFNQAAADGVAKWKFRPGQKAGRKVSTRIIAPINFQIVQD
jgi:protein TonB